MANPNSILFANIDQKHTNVWYEVKAFSNWKNGGWVESYNIEINHSSQMEPRVIRDVSKAKLELLYKFTVAVPGGHGMRMKKRIPPKTNRAPGTRAGLLMPA
jgi:hypothetical protein